MAKVTPVKEKPTIGKNIDKKIAEDISSSNPDASEIIWLPTGFTHYTEDKLYARRLKVKEVKLLSKSSNSPSLEFIVNAHKNALIGTDIGELYPVDFKFLMFFIAKLTKPDFNISGSYLCPNPECVKHNEHIVSAFNLEDIDWEEMPDVPVKVGDLSFTPLRIKDLLFMDKNAGLIAEKLGDEFDGDIAFMALMSNVDIADSDSLDVFIETYNSIGDGDWDAKLDDVVVDLYPDIKPMEVKCPTCDTEFNLELDLDYSRIYL